MTVSIESEEYLAHGGPIAGIAVYTDPISGEHRGFSGKDEAEAVQRARLDFVRRHGLDAVAQEGGE